MINYDLTLSWLEIWQSEYMTAAAIHIGTLDNPGWSLIVDLKGIGCFEYGSIDSYEKDDDDWFECYIRENRFEGAGGTENLCDIARSFYRWTIDNNKTGPLDACGDDNCQDCSPVVNKIQQWYKSNCDGDWEHTYGIDIMFVDSKSWKISIDLAQTVYEDLSLPTRIENRSTYDWFEYQVSNATFTANCGCLSLAETLNAFCSLVKI